MTVTLTHALKTALEERFAHARARHEAGGDGMAVSQDLCAAVDEAVLAMFNTEHGSFDGALVALGGYGRGALNPYSDVDLLFLLKDHRPGSGKPPDQLLASLWDLGLKVGHSSRAIADTIALGKSDLTARTAMMESRFLGGDRELYDTFRKKYFREVVRSKPIVFIQSKLEEMRRRHAEYGRFVQLTEPNLKESRGGLRDFQTAMWVIRSREDVATLDEVAARGFIPRDGAPAVAAAYSYIMRIRNSLHWRRNQAFDTLAHELQPDVARLERFEGSDNEVAAELMRRYYQAAEEIDHFAQELIAVAQEYKRGFFSRPLHKDNDGLFTDGRLLRASAFPPMEYEQEPALLFRIARRLCLEDLDPAPNLRRGLERMARGAPAAWFRGARAGRCLMSILRLPHSSRALYVFLETGLLERFIPEFKQVRHLAQFDMFHRYSVDYHILKAIESLEDITAGGKVSEELIRLWRAQEDLEVIKLALLLHDLGKRAEDHHAVEEDTHSATILRRLGLERHLDEVSFLVNHHLLMSVTAQRLNYADPKTLRDFCDKVNGRVNLGRLYLVTFADISAVGPDIWTNWKDKLLADLYTAAEQYYVEGETMFAPDPERLERLAQEAAALDGRPGALELMRVFLERAPNRYLRAVTPETVVFHQRLAERAPERGVALRFRPKAGGDAAEFTVASQSRIGFFSVIAGAFTAKNMSIVAARIHTLKDNFALDTFIVKGPNLAVYDDPHTIARFETELGELLSGARDVDEQVRRRQRYLKPHHRAAPLPRKPRAVIANQISRKYSVIEIWAADRVGLLYDITRTMAGLGLDIDSAKISTEGKMAVNVFYVSDGGGKIEDPQRQQQVTAALEQVIA